MSNASRRWEAAEQKRAELSKAKARAMLRLQRGNAFPYDAPDAWFKEERFMPPPPIDAAHCAARGVIAELQTRSKIGRAFEGIAESVRADIVQSVAEVIRQAIRIASSKPSTRRLVKRT
jgi:hypothetical protein